MNESNNQGMTSAQARKLEYSIIGFCVLAIVFIFQPFSQMLFSVGCVSVVLGGLAFNLVPYCKPGTTRRDIAKAGMTVVIVFVVVVILALVTTWAYGIYLQAK